MKIINPDYLMSAIRISPDTPKDICWLVRMLKGMVLFGDADLDKDKEKLTTYFLNWANNYSPQKILWGMEIGAEVAAELVNRAIKWVKEVELK